MDYLRFYSKLNVTFLLSFTARRIFPVRIPASLVISHIIQVDDAADCKNKDGWPAWLTGNTPIYDVDIRHNASVALGLTPLHCSLLMTKWGIILLLCARRVDTGRVVNPETCYRLSVRASHGIRGFRGHHGGIMWASWGIRGIGPGGLFPYLEKQSSVCSSIMMIKT